LSTAPAAIRPTAACTADIQSTPDSAPSEKTTEDGGRTGSRAGSRSPGAGRPTVVIHQSSPRCPTTTSGTTSTDEPVAGSKANEPNATRPVPGRRTSSVTTARPTSASHQACASRKRPGPVSSSRAASPQPTRPWPSCTQASAPASGSSSSSARPPVDAASRRTVDTVSNESAGAVSTPQGRQPPQPRHADRRSITGSRDRTAARTLTGMTELCSTGSRARAEPLTATASRVERWLLVEHRGAWGPESVPSSRLSPQLAHALAATAQAAGARLLMVRRPKGVPHSTGRWVYAADSRPGSERLLARHVDKDVDLMHLVLPVGSARATEGWQTCDGPLYLVCTHGRHDRCCALLGRPVAQALGRRSTRTGPGRPRTSAATGSRPTWWCCPPAPTWAGSSRTRSPASSTSWRPACCRPAGCAAGRACRCHPGRAGLRPRGARAGGARRTWTWSGRRAPGPTPGGSGSAATADGSGPEVEVVVRYDRRGNGERHVLSCDDDPKVAPVFRQVSLVELAARA
jgi:hypothetical protein